MKNNIKVGIVGDSVMWGQGLTDSEKFVNVARQLLSAQGVELNWEFDWYRPRSGARVIDQEPAGIDVQALLNDPNGAFNTVEPPNPNYGTNKGAGINGEIPSAHPNVITQLEDLAKGRAHWSNAGYNRNKVGEEVKPDLLIVNGFANDVEFTNSLTAPFLYQGFEEKVFKQAAYKLRLLFAKCHEYFPDVPVFYTGYYPGLSSESDLVPFLKKYRKELDIEIRQAAKVFVNEWLDEPTEADEDSSFIGRFVHAVTEETRLAIKWWRDKGRKVAEAIPDPVKNVTQKVESGAASFMETMLYAAYVDEEQLNDVLLKLLLKGWQEQGEIFYKSLTRYIRRYLIEAQGLHKQLFYYVDPGFKSENAVLAKQPYIFFLNDGTYNKDIASQRIADFYNNHTDPAIKAMSTASITGLIDTLKVASGGDAWSVANAHVAHPNAAGAQQYARQLSKVMHMHVLPSANQILSPFTNPQATSFGPDDLTRYAFLPGITANPVTSLRDTLRRASQFTEITEISISTEVMLGSNIQPGEKDYEQLMERLNNAYEAFFIFSYNGIGTRVNTRVYCVNKPSGSLIFEGSIVLGQPLQPFGLKQVTAYVEAEDFVDFYDDREHRQIKPGISKLRSIKARLFINGQPLPLLNATHDAGTTKLSNFGMAFTLQK